MSQVKSPSGTILAADIDGFNAALYPDENDNGSPMAGGNVPYRHGGGNEKSSFYMSGSTSRKDFGTANSNYFDGHAELLKRSTGRAVSPDEKKGSKAVAPTG